MLRGTGTALTLAAAFCAVAVASGVAPDLHLDPEFDFDNPDDSEDGAGDPIDTDADAMPPAAAKAGRT